MVAPPNVVVKLFHTHNSNYNESVLMTSNSTGRYTEPTLLIAGSSTGPDANPTHAVFNVFGSFGVGMDANNTRGAPFSQVFFSRPGRRIQPVHSVWDGAFAQELGLLNEDAIMLTQPSRSTTACFENIVGSRTVQDIEERHAVHGLWYRRIHERIMKSRAEPPNACQMIVMDRTEMPTRRWINAAPFVAKLRTLYPDATINFFNAENPLTRLTPRQQFALFSNASVFLGPQGGVEGNFVFMRPRSLIATLCCSYVAWALANGLMEGLQHEWHVWASSIRDDHPGFRPGQDYVKSKGMPANYSHRRAAPTLDCAKQPSSVAWLHRDFAVREIDDLFNVVASIASGPCSKA